MANLSDIANWVAGVRQLETTDPLLGGPGGVMNEAPQQLNNRICWLKKQFDDHGIPNAVEFVGNVNTLLETGVYHVDGSSTNLPIASTGFIFASSVSDGSAGFQLYFQQTSSVSYFRSRAGSAWSPWSEVQSGNQLTGAIMAFPSPTAPDGWLLLDGSLISRTAYSRLWAWVSARPQILVTTDGNWGPETPGMFSPGNGSTTFRLPDLRGYFIRGLDTTQTVDPGNHFGGGIYVPRSLANMQDDELKSHVHMFGTGASPFGYNPSSPVNSNVVPNDGVHSTTSTGGPETRPKNIAYNYFIKY